MVEKWEITIPELTGDAPRRAYAYLPTMYQSQPERRFPVLYMFDGHNVFFDEDATYGRSWRLANYLDYTDTPIIVAAVECNHSPDNGRLREYSPFTFIDPQFGRITGCGQQTMDWLSGPFKAEIDRRYRTLPDRRHTWIAGSSMGGLMSVYAVLAYNQVFGKAAALSPSLWLAAAQVERLVKTAQFDPDTVLYMDYGSRELGYRDNMQKQFRRVSGLLLDRRMNLTCRIIPGGNHNEASWERQIPFFLQTLLYEP